MESNSRTYSVQIVNHFLYFTFKDKDQENLKVKETKDIYKFNNGEDTYFSQLQLYLLYIFITYGVMYAFL